MFVTILITILYVLMCLAIADFISGVVHWAEDTWSASGMHPLLDKFVVQPNIEHHEKPGGIRLGNWWQTNRVTIFGAVVFAIIFALFHVVAWQAYLICLLSSHANQVHKWAHSSNVPKPVEWLQKTGLLQSRSHHGKHHRSPYAERFCAMTNYLNPILDKIHFWRGLEKIIVMMGGKVQRLSDARRGY